MSSCEEEHDQDMLAVCTQVQQHAVMDLCVNQSRRAFADTGQPG